MTVAIVVCVTKLEDFESPSSQYTMYVRHLAHGGIENVGAAILGWSGEGNEGAVMGSQAILQATYTAGGLLHWSETNTREVLPLRTYLAA
ncbi:MAG: hypothetical protein M1840_003500 [Geoglossum simile]|nr:MAG: hypothetical protein M1840_003500 [Geoglossum simile]